MRKLAPALLAALLVGAFVEAQTRCRNNTAWCIGSKDTDVIIGGNVYSSSPDGGLSLGAGSLSGTVGTLKADLVDAGNIRDNGALTVIGTTKLAGFDAGFASFHGNVSNLVGVTTLETVDAGAVNVQGVLGLNRPVRCGGATACGTCNLSSGTPSTCTATVESGSVCSCWPVGTTAAIAAGGCAANVAATTATFTGPNTVTTTIRYICWL